MESMSLGLTLDAVLLAFSPVEECDDDDDDGADGDQNQQTLDD